MPSYAPVHIPQPQQEADEAEYILAQEEYELQELIASMEEEQEQVSMEQQEVSTQHYGSDDEDYDSIFMECASATDARQRPQEQASHHDASFDDVDAMDIS